MSLFDEANALINKMNAAISDCVNNEVREIAEGFIVERTVSNVYTQYIPTQYIRRMSAGGLQDKNMWKFEPDGSSTDLHTIKIRDDRREVGIVESGVGYKWRNSDIAKMEPYPRPYFQDAENDTATSSETVNALLSALKSVI